METSLTSERTDIRIQHKQLPVQVVCKELIWTEIMDTCSHTMTWARLDRQVYVQMTTEDRVRFLSQKLQRSKALWQVGQTFLLR
jgi:hypothetical protein